MRRSESDDESGKRETGADCNSAVLEEHEPPAVGHVPHAAHRAAVGIDLDLDPDPAGTRERRNHVSVGRAVRLRISAEGTEIGGFVMLDEGVAIRLQDSPVAGLLDEGLAVAVDRLLALAGDGVHPLVLEAQPLVDCRGVALVCGDLLLMRDQARAIGGVCVTRGFSPLIGGRKLAVLGVFLPVYLLQLLLGIVLRLLQVLNLLLIVMELGRVLCALLRVGRFFGF